MAMRAYVSRRSAVSLLGAAAWGLTDDAEADSASEIRAAIYGAYILEEWHIDDGVFRKPQADGRFVILNGAVVTNLINKIQEDRQITAVLFGVYQLSAGSFSYRYDNTLIFTQTESTITVSHRLPWEGMRDFDIIQEGASVRLRSRSSEGADFMFSAEGLRYSEGGKLLRVWRRSILQ
jgi:hypothetical protein